MTTPTVSIVVPLYNKAPFVERCVASIRAQSMGDFEVIVVDDGSTDSSHDDFRRACEGDARFVLLRQPNGGVSRARNAAIARARAPLVAFLDADDEWDPGYLRAVVDVAARHPDAVIVGTAYTVIYDDTQTFVRQGAFEGRELVPPREFFDAWARLGNCPLFIGATAVRLDPLNAVGGFEPGMNLGEELLTFIRLLERGPVAFDDRPLATYRQSATGSLSTSPSVAAIRKHRLLLDELARQVQRGRCPPAIHRRWLAMHAGYLMQAGERAELMRLLVESPGHLKLREWFRAFLAVIGLRGIVRRLLGRA